MNFQYLNFIRKTLGVAAKQSGNPWWRSLSLLCAFSLLFFAAESEAQTVEEVEEWERDFQTGTLHDLASSPDEKLAIALPHPSDGEMGRSGDGEIGKSGEIGNWGNGEIIHPSSFQTLPTATQEQATAFPSASRSELAEEALETLSQLPSTSSLAPDEVQILSPDGGTTGERTVNLIVKYNADSEVSVSVNGNPLDSEIRTTRDRNEAENTITQVWYGIPLERGNNTIAVSANGGEAEIVELKLEERSAEIEVYPAGDPRVPADDRSTVTVEGTITDEEGELITEDILVTLTASAGEFVGADQDEDVGGFQVWARGGTFQAKLKSSLEAQSVRVRAAIERTGSGSDFPFSQVQEDDPIEAYTQVEFITYLRPSLMSGVIDFRLGPAGTNFWGSRRTFLDPDLEGTRVDLRGAAFATGAVGDWLFTGAYNSERPLNETCDGITRLFRGPQFCENQYPTYGDGSTIDYTTPSIDSVYLRFERSSPVSGAGSDYFMWGDYHTPELARASQEFTAITRELHGFKGNFNLGGLQISALFSPNVKGFQRDTLLPDGTSGYYFLSRRNLVEGSETIFIETEEINRPGTVLERKQLFRDTDYEIDYDRGTLLFRRPIQQIGFSPNQTLPGTENTVVRKIVASYQYEGNGDDGTHILAGRLQYNFSRDFETPIWLGATYFREDQGTQDFELYGADFLISLGLLPDSSTSWGQIVGEFAHSNASNFTTIGDNSLFPFTNDTARNPTGDRSGSAYRLEFEGNFSEYISARAYYRSVDEDFINNATVSFTPGQTRYGAGITAELGPTTTVQASYDHEKNFGRATAVRTSLFDIFNPITDLFSPSTEALRAASVSNSLTTFRAGVQQKVGRAELSFEYVNRSREDDIGTTFDTNSSQFVTNLRLPIFCSDEDCTTSTLAFRAQNELSLGGDDPLYPDRTTVGLDWDVSPGVKLRLAHQFFDGGLLGDNSITSLDTIVERELGENTTLRTRYSILNGTNGMTGQGAIGLNHRWVVSPGFHINLGYERILNNILGETGAGPRFVQPFAVGQSAASLGLTEGDSYSVGFEYTANPDFKASGRVDYRNSSFGNNVVITAAAAGKISPALTALFNFQQASSATPFLEGLGPTAKLRLGLAYRDPADDRFNALFRYEYRKNPSTIPDTLLFESGIGSNEHVLSAEAIYAPNWQWEFYSKFAMRHSTTFLSNSFSNSSLVYLGQLRTTYRFAYQWDVALEGRTIGQPSAGFTEWGWAAELGFYPTSNLRLGLGYSFGSVDDRDFDGFRSRGGVYFGVTFKLDELFGFGRQTPSLPPPEETTDPPPLAETNEPQESTAEEQGQLQSYQEREHFLADAWEPQWEVEGDE